jgi:hypothetical protein
MLHIYKLQKINKFHFIFVFVDAFECIRMPGWYTLLSAVHSFKIILHMIYILYSVMSYFKHGFSLQLTSEYRLGGKKVIVNSGSKAWMMFNQMQEM